MISGFAGSLFAQPGMGKSKVSVALAEEKVIEEIVSLTGTALPSRYSQVSAEMDGLVSERLAEEGDFVTSGGLLLRLRSQPTILLLREAAMRVALERAKLDELINGTREEDLAVKQAEVEEAEARVALAKAENDRIVKLLETRVSSQSDFDRTKAELDRATAELHRKQAEYNRAEKGARKEELDSARASLAAAEARAEQLRDQVERHKTRAPFTGVIGEKFTEVGQWVSSGDPLFTLAEVETIFVQVELPEKYFNAIKLGDIGHVRFDAIPGKTFDAPVVRRIPVGGMASRAFPIRLSVKNEGYQLAPGMFARVELNVAPADALTSLLVPKDALVKSSGAPDKIWTVVDGPDGPAAFPHEVTVGRMFRDMLEIVESDISPGDRIVIRGNERLYAPNTAVEILE